MSNDTASSPAPGNVIFVGAGPGNPDLLTVRAREVLGRTAVALTDPQVLDGVRAVVGSELAVPEDVLKAADDAYERFVCGSKSERCAASSSAAARAHSGGHS